MASYEALRRLALGQGAAADGPSLGLAILLRHGMVAWLRAWAICPRPVDPVACTASSRELPPLIHTELVQRWAQMALSHQEVAWI